MRATTRTVNGYRFGFMWGEINNTDGLTINPNEADFTSDVYLKALATATEMAKAFLVYCWVDEFITLYPDARRWSETDIHRFLTAAKTVMNQSYWNVSDDLKSAIEDACAVALWRQKKPAKPKQDTSKKRAEPSRVGYVYLVQSPTGAYKIGRTSDPDNRLKTFSVKLPFEVEYLTVIPSPDMYALEAELHRRYESKRVNGEWFALDLDDVAYLKTLAAVQS